MKKRLLSALLVAAMVGTMAVGCGSKADDAASTDTKTEETKEEAKTEEKKVIKLGVRDTPEAIDLCMDSVKAAGYEVEVTVFNDSIQPNVALAEGSIDCNWYQHEPYLDAYNKQNGTDFVMVQPKIAAPLFAMYSNKIKSLDELADGATIGICNDAANKARGMILLQDKGLIKLKDGVETPTELDIVENPKNLKFVEADMQVLPQSLPDVDAIILAAAHMVNAGLDANDYVCASDDAEKYAVGVVVRKEDADAQWATDFAKALCCDPLADYYKNVKKGTMVPMWQ